MMPTWLWGAYTKPEPKRGTRVWRVYLRGGRSFTFGLYFEHDKAKAIEHAKQWGEVIDVEAVT